MEIKSGRRILRIADAPGQTFVERSGTGVFEVQVVSWYDNEMSYVSQMVRTLGHVAGLL